MRIRRITIATAVLAAIAGAVIGGVAPASATSSFAATDSGTGPTRFAAELKARQTLNGDYSPCSNIVVIAEGQNPDGTWWAEVGGNCTGLH
jgi:hypothetical protein